MDIIITTMVMLKKGDEILVLNRIKSDWPGITFPGGHTESTEYIIDSAKREFMEETGLTLNNIFSAGYYEWLNNGVREVSFLYYSTDYSGTIKSSKEGEVFFIKEKDIDNYELSTDFKEIYEVIKNNIGE
ncbi:MAG: NUDIX domain-containing protein [Gammaproteobacteria bacterium]|nr:NUDIX domain-containing protein [Gammaproteobacteria bacterium]